MTASGQRIQETGPRGDVAAPGMLQSQNSVDRDAHSLFALLGLVKLMTAVILVLAGGLWYLVDRGRPDDRYLAMSFDGRMMQMQGLHAPTLNTNAMLAWVDQAVTQILTFGFNDINESFAVSGYYFTDVGWQSFNVALAKSAILKNMLAQQQLMTAIPTDTPRIVFQGLRQGDYVWDIQVPIVLTIRAGGVVRSAFPRLTVTVVAVPTRKNPSGLGIQKWVMY